jgi:predicted nucleic acid-binding protein
MSKPRFMLDSNVLIDTLNRKLDLLAFLDTLPDCELYINPVVWVETLAKPDMTGDEEAEARSLLSWFLWADIDASAISLKATVLSNDPHLPDFQREGYAAQPVVPAVYET